MKKRFKAERVIINQIDYNTAFLLVGIALITGHYIWFLILFLLLGLYHDSKKQKGKIK